LGQALALAWFLAWDGMARAQISYDSGEDTVFSHSETVPFWISGQFNDIIQLNPRFPSQYSGTNSFKNSSDVSDTMVSRTPLSV